jgi:hypothetical protein
MVQVNTSPAALISAPQIGEKRSIFRPFRLD